MDQKALSSPPSTSPVGAGGELPCEKHPETKFVLEGPRPLPKSLLWSHLKDYYAKAAISAWTKNTVPSFVTSNAKLALSYSNMILEFLRDWYAGSKTTEPVRILEIGAGHGKFSFLVLRALLRTQTYWIGMGLPERPFIYVYTDVAEANIVHCMEHASFAKMVKDGWLDFAMYDANIENAEPRLRVSGGVLSVGSPVVAICNYVLDSLLTDAYQVENGEFRRAKASLYTTQKEETEKKGDSAVIPRMSVMWEYENVPDIKNPDDAAHPLLTDPNVVEVLESYRSIFKTMSFVLPIGAFEMINSLRRLSNNRLMMLVGDKAYQETHDFEGLRPPHIAVHGSLSFMLNLHAIKRYFEVLGGFHESTPYLDTFQVTALWKIDGRGLIDFSRSRCSFNSAVADLPPDGLIAWKAAISNVVNSGSQCTLKELMLLLRHSQHDTEVFVAIAAEIRNAVAPALNAKRKYSDLAFDLERVYDNWYDLRSEESVPELIGMIFMRMGEIDKAIDFFQRSFACKNTTQIKKGDRQACSTYVNAAACCKSLGRLKEARTYAEKALEIEPSYEAAREVVNKIECCENPTRIALVGGNAFNRYEQAPILSRDLRFTVKAIFALTMEEADQLRAEFPEDVRESILIYTGNQGFNDMLQRNDIDACVVDFHQKLLPTFLPRIWGFGKHTLTPSPFVFKASLANELVYKTRHSVPNGNAWKHVAWSAAEPLRQDEAFAAGKAKLASLGAPTHMRLEAQHSRFSRPWHSQYSSVETLALELTHYMVVIRGIMGESCASFESIYAVYNEIIKGVDDAPSPHGSTTPKGFASGDKEKKSHKSDTKKGGGSLASDNGSPSSLYSTTLSTNSDRVMSSSGAEGGGRVKRAATLSGLLMVEVANDIVKIPVSFILLGPAIETSMRLSFFCPRGTMHVNVQGSAWTFTTIAGGTTSETTSLTTGNQSVHDSWLHHLKLKDQIKRGEKEPSDQLYLEKSVYDALNDCVYLDGIIASATKGSQPTVVSWSAPECMTPRRAEIRNRNKQL